MRRIEITALLMFCAVACFGCARSAVPLGHDPGLHPCMFRVVSGFGGDIDHDVTLHADQWGEVCSIFEPESRTGREERQRIRRAVARVEQYVGGQTSLSNDLPGNALPAGGGAGQMDCIAESRNATTYLMLFQQAELLRFHEVLKPAFRAPWVFDTHFSGQIREIATGQRYVVDTWFSVHGEAPAVQRVEDWWRKEPFPADENPPIDHKACCIWK